LIRKAATAISRNAPLQIALFFLPLVWIGYFAITSSERTEALQQARAHGNSVAELFEENTDGSSKGCISRCGSRARSTRWIRPISI
jgi:hypothetical protein